MIVRKRTKPKPKKQPKSRGRTRPTTKKLAPPVVISLLVDATQSMQKHAPQTMSAFNEYVDTLRKEMKGTDVRFTLCLFNANERKVLCSGAALRDVPPLTVENYRPQAWTNLIDASMQTIHETEKAVTPGAKVIVVFQTDGEENSSKEYRLEQLKAAIAKHSAAGWQFVYLGAGIDVYQSAIIYGLSHHNTMSYGTDRGATMAMVQSLTANSRSYSAGTSATMAFSPEQKFKAGDKFDPKLKGNVVHVVVKTP